MKRIIRNILWWCFCCWWWWRWWWRWWRQERRVKRWVLALTQDTSAPPGGGRPEPGRQLDPRSNQGSTRLRHQSVRVLPIVKVFCQEETWRMVDQWGSLAQMALPRLLPFLLLVGVLSLQEVEADAVADAASSQVKCSSYSDSIRVCLAIWKKGTERGLSWFINLANIFLGEEIRKTLP